MIPVAYYCLLVLYLFQVLQPGYLPNHPSKPICSSHSNLSSLTANPSVPSPPLICTLSHAISMCQRQFIPKQINKSKHTSIIRIARHQHPKCQPGTQLELKVGSIQNSRTGSSSTLAENGIVESRSGVVSVDVEIVVVVVLGGGLESEWFTSVPGEDGSGSYGGSEESERGKELHLVLLLVKNINNGELMRSIKRGRTGTYISNVCKNVLDTVDHHRQQYGVSLNY